MVLDVGSISLNQCLAKYREDATAFYNVSLFPIRDKSPWCSPSHISAFNDRKNSLSSRSTFLFVHLWCRCLITHIEQHFDFVIRCAAVKGNGDPVVLAHVICR